MAVHFSLKGRIKGVGYIFHSRTGSEPALNAVEGVDFVEASGLGVDMAWVCSQIPPLRSG